MNRKCRIIFTFTDENVINIRTCTLHRIVSRYSWYAQRENRSKVKCINEIYKISPLKCFKLLWITMKINFLQEKRNWNWIHEKKKTKTHSSVSLRLMWFGWILTFRYWVWQFWASQAYVYDGHWHTWVSVLYTYCAHIAFLFSVIGYAIHDCANQLFGSFDNS